MSTASVKKTVSKDGAGGATKVSATAGYSVFTTAAADSALSVLIAVDPTSGLAIPQQGDSHPENASIVVGNVPRVTRLGPTSWDIVVEYTANPQAVFETHPLKKKWEVEWDFVTSQEEIQVDVNGKPICNAAGQLFDPAPRQAVADLVLRITRNEAEFDQTLAYYFRNAINADNFMGALPGQAKIMPIKGSRKFYGVAEYWSVSYVIEFRPGIPPQADKTGGPLRAWWRRFENRGTYELRTDSEYGGGNLYAMPIYRDDAPVTTPVKLSLAGAALADNAASTFLEFQDSPVLPFSLLQLEPLDRDLTTTGPGLIWRPN